MFGFFKKKEKKIVIQEEIKISDEEIALINEKLLNKKSLLEQQLNCEDKDVPLIAKLYEDMGLIISAIDEDKAIEYFEQSLSHKLTITDGYKSLMNLYNKKRAEAARNGDDQGIEKWMNKMDDMRQIAKKVIIAG